MPAVEENPKLLRALTDFEKELSKANSLLRQDAANLKQSLASITGKAEIIEEIAQSEKESEKTIQRILEEKKLSQSFAMLSAAANDLKSALANFADNSTRTEVFLESLRRERDYYFQNQEQLLGFVQQLCSLYSISKFSFRPEFVGVIDLNETASSLKLERKDKQNLLVDTAKLPSLFDFLSKRKAARNFHLDAEEIKLLVKGTAQLKVEADNAKIKRLDRLAKELGARFD